MRKLFNRVLKSQVAVYLGKEGRSSQIPFIKRFNMGSCPIGSDEL